MSTAAACDLVRTYSGLAGVRVDRKQRVRAPDGVEDDDLEEVRMGHAGGAKAAVKPASSEMPGFGFTSSTTGRSCASTRMSAWV